MININYYAKTTILLIAIFCFSSFYNCGCKLCWNSERLLCLFWFRLGRYEHVPHNRRVVCKLSPHSLTTMFYLYSRQPYVLVSWQIFLRKIHYSNTSQAGNIKENNEIYIIQVLKHFYENVMLFLLDQTFGLVCFLLGKRS